jgi:tripartite-type tricarboxylate transporter receptor subunit TctC
MNDTETNMTPQPTRRHLLATAATAAVAGPWIPARAAAPARIVVGFPAGTSVDLLARTIAPAVEKVIGRTVIVENKPGAGGRFAPRMVYASKPDDALFTVIPGGVLTLFPFVYRNNGYEPTLTPICKLMDVDMGLCVSPKVPVQNMAQFREWLRTPEGARASYGSSGVGSIIHFLGLAVSRAYGANLNHVPYSGSIQMLADLSTGTLPMAFGTVLSWKKFIEDGRVRAIAVASPARMPSMPDIPTFRESGIDVGVTTWYALYGRPELPRDQVREVAAAVQAVMGQPEMPAKLSAVGTVAPAGPEEMARIQVAETALWRDLVRSSNFQPTE